MSKCISSKPCFVRSRGGFTLVELLVVISIIALLISILLPALSKARSAAVAIKCASNVRQVNLGLYQYQLDYKDWVLGYNVANANPSALTVLWFTVLVDKNYVTTSDANAELRFPAANGNAGKDALPPLRCVDEILHTRYSNQIIRKVGATASTQYVYSSSGRSRFWMGYSFTSAPGNRLNMKRIPEMTRAASAIPYFTCGDAIKVIDDVTDWQTYNMYVHNNATNTAFMDGHVSALTDSAITDVSQLAF